MKYDHLLFLFVVVLQIKKESRVKTICNVLHSIKDKEGLLRTVSHKFGTEM